MLDRSEAPVSGRERLLWQAIARGLKLIAAAIDQYLRDEAPARSGR